MGFCSQKKPESRVEFQPSDQSTKHHQLRIQESNFHPLLVTTEVQTQSAIYSKSALLNGVFFASSTEVFEEVEESLMGIEANEQLMTKAKQNAIQEAGKSIMQALKQHPEELSMLSQGTVVLGLHAGKLPVQLVQIKSNTTTSNMETLELKSTQNGGVFNSHTNANPTFKSIPLSMNSRVWKTGQNTNSSSFQNNMTQKTQTPFVDKVTSQKLEGLLGGASKATPSFTDSAHRFHRRQNELPRQELPRMPSLNGVAVRRGGRGSTREPPLKFTPNGLMTMTIPVLTGFTKLRQEAAKTKNGFSKTLESLAIAQSTGLNRNRSQVSDFKNSEVRALSLTPPQCDALNLVSDDETTKTPSSVVPQSLEETAPVWPQDKVEIVQQTELEEKRENWLESLEAMQPLLDAIEVLKHEDSTQSKTNKVSFFGRSKITKRKRSKRKGIRKTGWIKNHTKPLSFHQPVADGPQFQSIGEEYSKPRVLLDLESRNYKREPSLVTKKRPNEENGNLNAKRKKSIPLFCPVDQANKGLDKTSNSMNIIKESQDEDNALWEFLKQGCDTCTSINSSSSPSSTEEKSVPCISVLLPESALLRRTSEFTSVGDKVWNRVKLCVDGMSQRYVESMIQQYSLCGFSAALISACSQQ